MTSISTQNLTENAITLISKDLNIEDKNKIKSPSKSLLKRISENSKYLVFAGLLENDKLKINNNYKSSELKLNDIIDFVLRTKEVKTEIIEYFLREVNKKLTFKVMEETMTNFFEKDENIMKLLRIKKEDNEGKMEFESRTIAIFIKIITDLNERNKKLISKDQCEKMRLLLCVLFDRKERKNSEIIKIRNMEMLIDLCMIPNNELEYWKMKFISKV